MGHVVYCAASVFLDAFAHHKALRDGVFSLSINWDAWQEIGGVVEIAKKIDKALGSSASQSMLENGILPGEGIDVFSRVMACRTPQILVSTQDLSERLKKKEGAGEAVLSKPAYQRPKLNSEYVAPGNKLEQMLVEIFQQLFGITQVGIHDDCFELGGDSLIGITLISRIKEQLGEIIHITVLFDAPTISGLAFYIDKHYPEAAARITGSGTKQETGFLTKKIDSQAVEKVRQLIPALPPRRKVEERKNPPAVFILAPPRSGSTLLRVILGGHPKLFAPPELELLSFNNLEQRKASFPDPAHFLLEGTIRAIMQIKNCNAEKAESIMKEAEDQQLSTKDFYLLLQEWLGDTILVDKTPGYALNPDVLRRAESDFENSLYIHLLRHPYGMIRSYEEAKLDLLTRSQLIEEYSFTRREIAELIWVISQQNIRDFFETIPAHRQYRLKFEDLVKQPQEIVEGICRFLSLDFFPEMVQPYKEKKQRMTDGVYPEGMMIGDVKFHRHKSIDAGVADTWKEAYSSDFLGDVTWQVAESFGYERSRQEDDDTHINEIKRTSPTKVQKMLNELDHYSDTEVDALLKEMLSKKPGGRK